VSCEELLETLIVSTCGVYLQRQWAAERMNMALVSLVRLHYDYDAVLIDIVFDFVTRRW
jgi:hypothetical protein